MDADIGVSVLDFSYMKGAVAHAGFPEVGYGKFAERLVQAGYKVARVEQTETPQMLAQRKKATKKGHKKPQVVNREVCSILTCGTRTHCFLDPELMDSSATPSCSGPLLAIKEILLEAPLDGEDADEVQPACEYGITIVDAARAQISIGQFADDALRSRMNTLLTTFCPSEVRSIVIYLLFRWSINLTCSLVFFKVLLEGGENGVSPTLLSMIRGVANTPRIEIIQQSTAFPRSTAIDANIRRKLERKCPTAKPWDVQETLDEIHRRGYFPRSSKQDHGNKGTNRWPPVLHAAVDGGANLALSSFGSVLFYLQRNLIDQELLSMGSVKAYIPPSSAETNSAGIMDGIAEQTEGQELDLVPPMTPNAPDGTNLVIEGDGEESPDESATSHMALDGTTLQNLEVLSNASTFKTEGSLWSKINYTKTPHGSRMLRAWLLRPLFRKVDITRRADAVEELLSGSASVALSEARGLLAKCGDIERLISRIHSMSGTSGGNGDIHPSERAVLYEAKTHTKRKVGDFQKLLIGLRNASQIPELFDGIDVRSGLLRKIVCPVSKGGCFPEMDSELDWFFNNFDCEKAAKGEYQPSRGVDKVFDEACDTIERIKAELEEYKEGMCANTLRGSSQSSWKYINTKDESKDKYLIELPAHIRVPSDFIVKAKR